MSFIEIATQYDKHAQLRFMVTEQKRMILKCFWRSPESIVMQGVLKKLLNLSGTPGTLSRLCIEVYVINRNKAFAKRQMGIRYIAVTSQISNDKKNK